MLIAHNTTNIVLRTAIFGHLIYFCDILRYFFICDQWLAVDEEDGKVDRILPLASPENMSTFHRLFVSTTAQKFTEDHLWISVSSLQLEKLPFLKSVRSLFNKSNWVRFTAQLFLLFLHMCLYFCVFICKFQAGFAPQPDF